MSGDVDVCIVGAGAGGSALAHGLARGGLSVLVLDVGERPDRSTIPMARPDWELHKRRFTPGDAARDRVVYAPGSDPGFTIRRFKGLGGSTMHFEGFVPRHHPHDWQRKTRLGIGADWPIGQADLAPDLARVETALGVSGAMDNPFEPPRPPYPNPAIGMSCAVQRLAAGARSLGLHPAHAPLAILSRPAPGRAACNYCGGCWHGCMRGAISNASQAHLGPRMASPMQGLYPGFLAQPSTKGAGQQLSLVVAPLPKASRVQRNGHHQVNWMPPPVPGRKHQPGQRLGQFKIAFIL